jgi:hypothetical protein
LEWRRSTFTLLHLSLTDASPACPPNTLAFIVYPGDITEAFLAKFHNPFKAPPNGDDATVSGITIEYTRVPIWPILGLQERLDKALGQELVGAFNPEEIRTCE